MVFLMGISCHSTIAYASSRPDQQEFVKELHAYFEKESGFVYF